MEDNKGNLKEGAKPEVNGNVQEKAKNGNTAEPLSARKPNNNKNRNNNQNKSRNNNSKPNNNNRNKSGGRGRRRQSTPVDENLKKFVLLT